MVVKIMGKQKFCQSCVQKQQCRDIYQKLGNAKGPSVVSDVIMAFLLPIAVFITVLAISRYVADTLIAIKWLQTSISFLSAVLAVFIYILIIRTTGKKFFMNKKLLEH